jgi:hypothetical protein
MRSPHRLLSQRRKSLLLAETLREREGFANDFEQVSSELCVSRQRFAHAFVPRRKKRIKTDGKPFEYHLK